MTSVVGILNRRGIAIAADSAVTRNRYKENGIRRQRISKYTKNGNKMVRLCEAVPITVMFTGNAEFLGTTWDVIARRYRQKRGKVAHERVEDAVNDFFSFIHGTPVFWNELATGRFMGNLIKETFNELASDMNDENKRACEGEMVRPKSFIKAFGRNARNRMRKAAAQGACPQFADYTIEQFRENVRENLDSFLHEKTFRDDEELFERYPKEVLDAIRPALEEALFAIVSSRLQADASAELIFSGFGADEEFPSLVPVMVCEGYEFRVNYNYRREDIVSISDRRPVAICPFAQDDVIKSILCGIHTEWSGDVCKSLNRMFNPFRNDIFKPEEGEEMPEGLVGELLDVRTDDFDDRFYKEGMRMLDGNQREWEKALKDYDLEEMAALADSLIDLTGFHRILTFSNEGVGGTVDLAAISKADGFTWLRRKNWYHKDNGLGI